MTSRASVSQSLQLARVLFVTSRQAETQTPQTLVASSFFLVTDHPWGVNLLSLSSIFVHLRHLDLPSRLPTPIELWNTVGLFLPCIPNAPQPKFQVELNPKSHCKCLRPLRRSSDLPPDCFCSLNYTIRFSASKEHSRNSKPSICSPDYLFLLIFHDICQWVYS